MSRNTETQPNSLSNPSLANEQRIHKLADIYQAIIQKNGPRIDVTANFLFNKISEGQDNRLACSYLAEKEPIVLYVLSAATAANNPDQAVKIITEGKNSKNALKICEYFASCGIAIAQYLLGHIKSFTKEENQFWFEQVVEASKDEQKKFDANKAIYGLAEAYKKLNMSLIHLGWVSMIKIGDLLFKDNKNQKRVRLYIRTVEEFETWYKGSNINTPYNISSYLFCIRTGSLVADLEKETHNLATQITKQEQKAEGLSQQIIKLLSKAKPNNEIEQRGQNAAMNSILNFYWVALRLKLPKEDREQRLSIAEVFHISCQKRSCQRQAKEYLSNIIIFSEQYDSVQAHLCLAYLYSLRINPKKAEHYIRKSVPMEVIEALEDKNYNSLLINQIDDQTQLEKQIALFHNLLLAFKVLLEVKLKKYTNHLGSLTTNQDKTIKRWLDCINPFQEFAQMQIKLSASWASNQKAVKEYRRKLMDRLQEIKELSLFTNSSYQIITDMVELDKKSSQDQDFTLPKEELKNLEFMALHSKLSDNLVKLLHRSRAKLQEQENIKEFIAPLSYQIAIIKDPTQKTIEEKINQTNQNLSKKRKEARHSLRIKFEQQNTEEWEKIKEEDEIELEIGGLRNYCHINIENLHKLLQENNLTEEIINSYCNQAKNYNTLNKVYSGSKGCYGVKHLWCASIGGMRYHIYRLRAIEPKARVILVKIDDELLAILYEEYFHSRSNSQIIKQIRDKMIKQELCNKPTSSPAPYFQESVLIKSLGQGFLLTI